MSTETQKKLLFIPIANLISLFCWIKACYDYQAEHLQFLRTLFIMFVPVIIFAVIQITVQALCPIDTLNTIVSIVCSYALTVALSYLAIRAQEQIV